MTRRVWFAVAAAFLVGLGIVAFVSYRGEDRSGTSAQQLSAWVKDTSLGQELGALHDDGLDLQKVLARHAGTDAVHTVCGVLTVTAEQAHGNLPSTDTELTLLLDRVYQLDAEAGNDCYAAGATNKKLLAKSASERAQAQQVAEEALARVAAVTGRTISTTTTTQPTTGTGIFG
jgi:hypothetical protein